ncbi:beta-aspartyl-peptidase [Aliikangiella marina]|uniref:Isoaspartyl dipeptidase n=1 Tax=Aliikangiella marina TaxID=1712262 RepID=A0A545TE59_9GAMM|nr:beta-aspartyl-peptidase [Aliikangiella marina]TQV75490.1 beta-aspartyl-peptidase [Aliikangiella marina]
MLTLIKNAEVVAPVKLGKQDVLICGEKILAIESLIEINSPYVALVDASDKIMVPGFVDSLVHITGGGGEGGFTTRTPEVNLTDLTTAGITTLVAALGTDSISRSLNELLVKAKELNAYGLSCYIYSGSYHLPLKTITGDLQSDIVLIDECIGVGEVAIADHRGSQPHFRELARIASDARVGGMLSGKSGIVSIHMGPGNSMFSLIDEVVEKTDIPISQFYPTHINRNKVLFNAGIDFTKRGGYIDLTTSSNSMAFELGEIKCSKGLKEFLDSGGDIQQITFSSDGHASLPEFDEAGNLISLEVGNEGSLFREVRDCVLHESIPLEVAIQAITSTPADVLKLKNKGRLQANNDADLVLLEKQSLHIESVMSKGQWLVRNQTPLIKGTFES